MESEAISVVLPDEERRSLRIARALWPVAVFLLLTALMTWPLVIDLGGSLIYGATDNGRAITPDAGISRWDLWWFKTSLLGEHTDPFYTDRLYFPYRDAANPLPLYYHTLQPLHGLLALPVLLLTGPTVGPTLAYNLLMLLHLVLTGLAGFWLARYLTGSAGGGLAAGVLFSFGAFHQYHIHEAQLELMPLEWLPLGVLFMHRWLYLPEGLRRPRDAVLAVGCLLGATFSSWYLVLYLLGAIGLLVLVRLVERPPDARRTLLAACLVLGGWALLCAPFLRDTIRAGNDPTFELVSGPDYEVRFSLSPLDLITAAKDTRMNPAVWFLGPLGWSAMLLGAVGAVRMRRRGAFWLLLVVVGVVLALGPYLKWGDAGDVAGTTGVPLPYFLLRNLPFISISRVPRRFIVLADLGLDVLAGCGVAFLLAWVRQRSERLRPAARRLPVLAALVLILAISLGELAVIPQPLHKVSLSPFFSTLAQQPGDLPILEMPVTTHYVRDHPRMFYQTIHGKPIFGGYIARRVHDYYSDSSSPFQPFLNIDTSPAPPDILPRLDAFSVLNYYNVPYIVYYKHDDSFQQPGDNLPWEAYLRKLFPDRSAVVADDDVLTAYKVPQMPATELTWLGSGWYDPQTVGGQAYRWSNGGSSLYIETKVAETKRLHFSAATYAGETDLDVTLNGTSLLRAHLYTGLQSYDAGTLHLSPGLNEIDFHGSSPPVVPVLSGGAANDHRRLTFRVTGLDLR